MENPFLIHGRLVTTIKNGNSCGTGSKIALNMGNDLPCSLSKEYKYPNVRSKIGKTKMF